MRISVALPYALLVLAVAACTGGGPRVHTQSAEGVDLSTFQTYGFMERPTSDAAGYRTLTTGYIQDAVAREMQARGYTLANNPDLLINFHVESSESVDGGARPNVSVGMGSWRGGYGWGIGVGSGTTRTVSEGSLTIDVVDRERNTLVWSGTASGRIDRDARENPQPAIDSAVREIFARYPVTGGAR